MPHTSHRHRQPPRPKRTQTTDANGWTTIQHGPKPSPSPRPPALPTPSLCTPNACSPNTAPSVSSSDLEALKTHYAHHKHLWTTSTCAATLRTILAERVERNDMPEVRNCVVLGLGSLSSAYTPGAARKSLLQLAALEDVLQCLSAFSPPFTCIAVSVAVCSELMGIEAETRFPHLRDVIYAQDPAFEALDIAFLASRGVTVLEVPGASERVGRGTVLYAPHCARSAYMDALGGAPGKRGGGMGEEDGWEVGGEEGEEREEGPALVLGNDVAALIDGKIETPPSMTRIGKAFLGAEGRRSVAFPRFEADETVFWDMRIYWRGREDVKQKENE